MVEGQVLYMGRWVSREHFKTFVYNADGQKLAKTYEEFSNLISSGLWSAEPYVYKAPPTPEDILKIINEDRAPKKQPKKVVDIKPMRIRKCQSKRKA